jgi:Permuted papain-like amidase enzyme, YaeF/YiiX, C92 family
VKRLLRILAYITLATFVLAVGLFAWLKATTVVAADLPALKNGDLVFQHTNGKQDIAIVLASHSPYSHMGMIELHADGKPWVIEAVGPVRSTPLDKWINHGTGGRITIKRIAGLSPEDAAAAIKQAHRYDGLPYDIFFLPSRDQIYCSELVHAAFTEGPKIDIGRVQKVKELNIDSAAVRRLIEARWTRHPLCKAAAAKNFEDCYTLILDQPLATPASIARDSKMQLVFSNFGALGD